MRNVKQSAFHYTLEDIETNAGKKGPESNTKKTTVRNERGFSLIEALIAMGITLVILAAVFGIFKSMTDTKVAAAHVSEINSDIQSAMNIIRRDLQKVRRYGIIPDIGIPVPDLSANINAWENNRCFHAVSLELKSSDCQEPGENDILLLKGSDTDTRGIAARYALDVVTPGIVNGYDAVSILYVDDANGISASLSGNTLGVTPGSTDNRFNSLRRGDFIYIKESGLVQYVVSDNGIGGNSVTVSDGPGVSVSSAADDDDVTVYLLRRVTYYLDRVPTADQPAWLMRQVNLGRPPVRIIPGITAFKITYDILDDATGSTGLLEINISEDIPGNMNVGTEYSDIVVGHEDDAEFFIDNPRRIPNIRRVNINISRSSDSAVIPGGKNSFAIDQTAKIAVYGVGLSNPPGPPDPPDPPAPPPVSTGCNANSSGKGALCNTACAGAGESPNNSVPDPTRGCYGYYYTVTAQNDNCDKPRSEPLLRKAGEPKLDSNGEPVLDGNGEPELYEGGEPVLDDDGEQIIIQNWIAVTQGGNPHMQHNTEKGYDHGIAVEFKNVPSTGYYCIITERIGNPTRTAVSDTPMYIRE